MTIPLSITFPEPSQLTAAISVNKMASDSVVICPDVSDNSILPITANNEAELLIIASIKTLKRKNKLWCKDKVFELMKYFFDDAVTRETYDELLNKLIHSKPEL